MGPASPTCSCTSRRARSRSVGPVPVAHPRLVRVGQVTEDKVPDLVAAMDVGLAPYASDAPPWFCPLKVLAYRAQGTPVVATNVGDCLMLVGDAGTVVDGALDALIDATRAWRGRRCSPYVRGWDAVVREAVAPVLL